MMYLMVLVDKPLDIAGYCLQGFLKKYKLSEVELEVLYYCVAARFVVSLVLGLYYYSISKDPYNLITQKGWKQFQELWETPAEDALKYWLSEKFQSV